MIPLIEEHLEEIAALCREFGVARLEVFGTAATGAFDPERSDVDFLVEYAPETDLGPWLRRFFELRERLSELEQEIKKLAAANVAAVSREQIVTSRRVARKGKGKRRNT